MSKVPKHIPLPGRDPCPYCVDDVVLFRTSEEIYGKDYGPVWVCKGCGARVGCHPGTFKALGRVADADLRKWKMIVHKNLDPLWQWKIKYQGCRKKVARGKAYKWLLDMMKIDQSECHVGYFNVMQCKEAYKIIKPHKDKLVWR